MLRISLGAGGLSSRGFAALRLLALCVLVSACQCSHPGGPDAGTGRVVEVSRFRLLISDTGREQVPFVLVDGDITALIHDDAGELLVYPDPSGAGAVTFRNIPPDAGYVLSLTGYNLFTDENALDLGVASLGRSSAALTDGGTVLQLSVAGLQPWVPYSDVLQLTSANAGYVAVNAQSYAGGQPDAGATDWAATLDWQLACNTTRGDEAPLHDSDAGDVAVLTQLAAAPIGDAGQVELRALVRAATLPPFTLGHGATLSVAAPMAPPATVDHLSLDFRQSEFEAHRLDVHAAAQPSTSTVTVSALPYTADEGAYTATPDLAVLRAVDPTKDIALSFDTGDPFPAAWPKLVNARYAIYTNFDYPDGGSRGITTATVVQDVLTAFASAPIRPRVSPPLNVRIEGAPANVRAEISRVAVLEWDAPAVGSPNAYGVTLFHLARIGSGPTISVSEDSIFVTTERRLQLPFGELVPGEEYVFGVTAFDSPNAQVTKAPFKLRLPFGAATALTALHRVRPPGQ